MNVTGNIWMPDITGAPYRAASKEQAAAVQEQKTDRNPAAYAVQEQKSSVQDKLEQMKEQSKSGSFKMKSSIPDDSVGQLASMLARAETKLDLIEVSAKATRALLNLKAAAISCDEKDRKKVTQRIRRMEKLIKRITKKQRLLTKEEALERQRAQAQKRKEAQKEQEIAGELRKMRNKRRREERKYAQEEISEDRKEAMQETMSSIAGFSSSSSPSAPAAMADTAVAAAAAPVSDVPVDVAVADFSPADAGMIDVSV